MKPYNIFKLNITEGLQDKEIANGMDYLVLLSVPTSANVTVKIDDINASEIPLKENFALVSRDVEKLYLNCNPIDGETITIGQSDTVNDFQLITSPTINKIESMNKVNEVNKVTDFDSILLDKLDKIINPYIQPIVLKGSSSSTSLTTLLNKKLDCDKITIDLNMSNTSRYVGNGNILALLDGVAICSFNGYGGDSAHGNNVTVSNIRGSLLEIQSIVVSSTYKANYLLQEFTLKA